MVRATETDTDEGMPFSGFWISIFSFSIVFFLIIFRPDGVCILVYI